MTKIGGRVDNGRSRNSPLDCHVLVRLVMRMKLMERNYTVSVMAVV